MMNSSKLLSKDGGDMELNTMADWEKWVELAREDPEKFEKERAGAIEELIMGQPAQSRHRSRQLQWKIDAVRQTSPNALCACIRIYAMLIDAAYGSNGLIEAIGMLGGKNSAPDRRVMPVRKKGFLLHFTRQRG
jgi:hypothetical protein